jgi:hypothetical protein
MKIRKLYIYILVAILGPLSSCEDKFFELNKEPQDRISGATVFKQKKTVEAALAQIYDNTLFRYGNYGAAGWNNSPVEWGLEEGYGAEARGFAFWQPPSWAPLEIMDQEGAGHIDYWPYGNIRNANEFIQGIKESEFDQEYIDQKMAEARYCRAHMYWQMVKRYGGVPLVTKPQSIDTPLEELQVPRSSEQEIFDFIASEMDAIKEMLVENADAGRVDKYVALALKSRAMLYAASVAEFGEVQLDGLLGIPSSEADQYWQASLDASEAIMNSGQFSLYNKIPGNPQENFEQLFIEDGNSERIFVTVADPTKNKGHSRTTLSIPFEFRSSWGSNFCPFLNIVEEFEYADGTSGEIDRDLIESDHLFDIDSVFKSRDPRFQASFFFPESNYQGGIAHFHKETVMGGDTLKGYANKLEGGWPAGAPRRNWINTGFLVRKRCDESHVRPSRQTQDEDFMVFRYGEILLNYAEAAYYLGQQGEALDKVNMIRERAGMPTLSSITEEDIRHERQVELFFEDKRYWDLKRWRVAHEFLDGLRAKGLEYTYHWEEDKYDFHLKNGMPEEYKFEEHNYYMPLGVDRLADNPALVENPGY